MVWLSGAPVPSEHPDQDQLADLAAEILPAEIAQQLQNHVIGCARCAALLAEAEGIRVLLRQSQPEPMPEEVWARLERALTSASAQPSTSGSTQTSTLGSVETSQETSTQENESGRRGRRAARSEPTTSSIPTTSLPTTGPSSGPTAPGPTGPPPTGPMATGPMATGPMATGPMATGPMATGPIGTTGPPTSRLSRMSRPTQRARRQAIEEQRADRPSLLSRTGPFSRVAAGVVILLGAGALTLHLSGGHLSSSESSGSTASSAGPVPVLVAAPVQATGTNYSRSQLASQIPALVSSAQTAGDAASGAALGSATENSMKSAAKPATATRGVLAPQAAGSVSPQVLPSGQPGELLRSPQALQACLTAIGADQRPVAVDLARYAGQEAAIIVLPSANGGYQVEVVARDCRPGDDGSIDVVTVPSS